MDSSSQPAAMSVREGGEGNQRREEEEEAEEAAEEEAAEAGNGSQLVVPEDGYEWKKYGQKFIKNIQKIRSYFRCRHRLCGAKKKVEWHPRDPSAALRVVYDGAHQHGAAPPPAKAEQGGGAGASSNRYELGAQYFGGAAGAG